MVLSAEDLTRSFLSRVNLVGRVDKEALRIFAVGHRHRSESARKGLGCRAYRPFEMTLQEIYAFKTLS
jgi:hypothetical protein